MGRLLSWRSRARLSLRARLLIAVVGLMAIALVTTGIVGTTLLRSYLTEQVDEQLKGGVVVLSRVPPGPPPAGAPRDRAALPTQFWFTHLD